MWNKTDRTNWHQNHTYCDRSIYVLQSTISRGLVQQRSISRRHQKTTRSSRPCTRYVRGLHSTVTYTSYYWKRIFIGSGDLFVFVFGSLGPWPQMGASIVNTTKERVRYIKADRLDCDPSHVTGFYRTSFSTGYTNIDIKVMPPFQSPNVTCSISFIVIHFAQLVA